MRDPLEDPQPGDRVRTRRGAVLVVEGGHNWGPGTVKFSNLRTPQRVTVLLDREVWRQRVRGGIVLHTATATEP